MAIQLGIAAYLVTFLTVISCTRQGEPEKKKKAVVTMEKVEWLGSDPDSLFVHAAHSADYKDSVAERGFIIASAKELSNQQTFWLAQSEAFQLSANAFDGKTDYWCWAVIKTISGIVHESEVSYLSKQ